MTIRAVIFDIGGVILRTADRLPRTKLAERLGMTYAQLSAVVFDSPSAIQASFGEITEEQHWEKVCLALHQPLSEGPALAQAFFTGDIVDMELVGFIHSLRPRYKTAIISNAWSGVRATLQDNWKIIDAFDQAIFSAEVGLAKPDPRIFELAISRLNVAPAEVVFVDDFLENVEAARKAGMQAIQYRNNPQLYGEIKPLLDGSDPS